MALTTIDDRGLKTPIDLIDNEKIRFGTGNDLEIYHEGSNSWIRDLGTGSLVLSGSTVQLKSGNGAEACLKAFEDGTVELYYDNVKKLETASDGVKISGHLDLEDDLHIRLGTGDDYHLWHSSDVNYLSTAGTFKITNSGAGETLAAFVPDGAVELYYDGVKKLETVANGIRTEANLFLNDSTDGNTGRLKLGDGQDIQIYHTGSHSYLDHKNTGHLYIRANVGGDVGSNIIIQPLSGENGIITRHNGASELYYDGSKKLETDSGGVTITGQCAVTSHVAFPDHTSGYVGKAVFGAGDDLQIYHDGSHSFIKDDGTGNLHIDSVAGSVKIRTNTNENSVVCNQDGAVELYYDNSKKFETTSTGINVTGDIHPSGHIYMDSGYGVAFDPYGSSGANLLDDYEEGTFTVADASGNSITITNEHTANYVKIGQFVYLQIDITYGSISNGNVARITVPFQSGIINYGGGSCGWTDLGRPVFFHMNTAGAYLLDNNGTDAGKNLSNTECSGKRFIGQLTYKTTA